MMKEETPISNLIYIIGTYPQISTTFIDREIKVLCELGFAVQIVSIRHPDKQVSLKSDYQDFQTGIIYLLPSSKIKLVNSLLYFGFRKPGKLLGIVLYLFTRPHPNLRSRFKTLIHIVEGIYSAFLLRNMNGHHVHAHFIDRSATVAYCVSRLLGMPYSITAHAFNIFVNPILLPEKICESKFTITVSQYNKNYLLDKYPAIGRDKIQVLHPWIDLNDFKPMISHPQNDILRILSVGRLVEKKGHHFLVDACAILDKAGLEFECYIIGEGPYRPLLEEKISSKGLSERVFLLGGRSQKEVISQLEQADVFVLACTISKEGDRDGMPVSIAEAMAVGLPVISTDFIGINEMVDKEVGILITRDNVSELADAIIQLDQIGSGGRMEMGRKGREKIQRDFDLYEGIKKLAALYKSKPS